MKNTGFTLVELVLVMVVMGILAATVAVFIAPAVDAYTDSRRRAGLTDTADTALRRIAQDIRRAVPNSVIRHGETCIQLVPTMGGGRYRMATDPDAASEWLDMSAQDTLFDILTPLEKLPAANDWVVVDNQNGSDVYTGRNREQLKQITALKDSDNKDIYRVELKAGKQFSPGYDAGRFLFVADSEQSVFYNCVIPASGATGRLYRTTAAFGAPASTCSSTGALLAADVDSCVFTYEAGATQQSGMVWLTLQLQRDGERITLVHGAHVDNVP